MAADSPGEVTALLRNWRRGDHAALSSSCRSFRIAFASWPTRTLPASVRAHLLQTTSLVNEAYIKLVQINRVDWEDRAHFLAMAATVMRRVLVSSRATGRRSSAAATSTSSSSTSVCTGPGEAPT